MKVRPFLWLLLLLSACAAPGVNPGAPRLAAATPLPSTPTVNRETGVLLNLWNEQQHHHEVHLVDPATGQNVPSRTLSTISSDPLYALPAAILANGQQLMVVGSHGQSCEPFAGGTSCRPSGDELLLVNLLDWHQVKAELPGHGWVGAFSFNPQNNVLAISYELKKSSTLLLFDVNTGRLMGQRTLDFRPSLVGYALDGLSLVLYGASLGPNPGIAKPGPPHLLLVEAATLDTQWEHSFRTMVSGSWCEENCAAPHSERLFAHWSPAVVLSPDGRQFYLVHANEEKLTTVDLTARVVRSVELQAAHSWFETLLAYTASEAQAKGRARGAFKTALLSTDGTRLFVLGQRIESDSTPEGQDSGLLSGLQVIEVESGRKVATLNTEASGMRLTPDGAYLLLDGWGEQEAWMEARDPTTLKRVAHLTGWEVSLSRQTDGQPVILAQRPGQKKTTLAVLNPGTLNVALSWQVEGNASWVVLP